MTDNPEKLLYRYEDAQQYNALTVRLRTFVIVKTTPKGFWHVPEELTRVSEQRWTNNYSRKRFCYPTKEEAWESYRSRKHYHLERLQDQLKMAQARFHALQRPEFSYPPDEDKSVLTPYAFTHYDD